MAEIASSKPRKRCAVYCRVSSDERLDQEFNSIDAQKEAGHAYIASQRAEGWIPVADDYDDGGFSGGNMERPALKRLMVDIDKGLVDIVVVYKIDRLTRSLADFSKMVEVFERRSVSFVSVTQQFNTTTSMGRLTLNILLSLRRRGVQHLVQQPVMEEREAHDSTLIEGMGRAFHWQRLLDSGEMESGSAIARAEGLHQSVVNELLRLTLFAPDIVESLMAGRQPRRMSLIWFQRHPLPVDWEAQQQIVRGFEGQV